MLGRAILEFFDRLFKGDPVAVGMVVFFAALAAGLGLYMLKIHRDHQREDEEALRRLMRRPPDPRAPPAREEGAQAGRRLRPAPPARG